MILRHVEGNIADRLIIAAGVFLAAPFIGKRLRRRRIGGERLGHAPEQLRKVCVSQPLQTQHRNPDWNRKSRDADDRTGIDAFDHDMGRRAEFGFRDGKGQNAPAPIRGRRADRDEN